MSADVENKVVLTVEDGPQRGKIFEFREGDNFLLGRDAPGSRAHFRLTGEDVRVSRNHFLVEINPPDCYLRDAGSTNGTYVIRDDTLLLLRGSEERDAREWLSLLHRHQREYALRASREEDSTIKLRHGDRIRVGRTVLKVEVIERRIDRHLSEEIKEAQLEGLLHCVGCGSELSSDLLSREVGDVTSADFMCCRCQQSSLLTPKERPSAACCQCSSILTARADSDGRAADLADVATYICDDCVQPADKELSAWTVGGYRLLRRLGVGGFGVVYLARDDATARLGAVKVSKEKIKRTKRHLLRMKRGTAIAQALHHPNLVRLYDTAVSDDERYYSIWEYLPEGSLQNHFARRIEGKLAHQDACAFMAQALEGMSLFHERGFVHRDLKPDNILLSRTAKQGLVAKVGDFDLARSYVCHGGTLTKDESGGTPIYCPPEQIYDFKNVKPAADVYAMGMSLYLLIAGEFPYDIPSPEEVLKMLSAGKKPKDPMAIILGSDKPTPIQKKVRDIPKVLAQEINRAIDKDPSKRHENARELKQAIERFA